MFPNFKRFKLLVEKQYECDFKKFRTNGDAEYKSIEFSQFCEKDGIKTTDIITPYTPQHNGITQIKNKIILNMVRNIIKARQFTNHSWGRKPQVQFTSSIDV